jgi:hypothetical protein
MTRGERLLWSFLHALGVVFFAHLYLWQVRELRAFYRAAAAGNAPVRCAPASSYSLSVKAALELLAEADSQAHAYVLHRAPTITELDGPRFYGCFGRPALLWSPPLGITDAHGNIFLNLDGASTTSRVAAAIAHEIVHVQQGDPDLRFDRESLLHQLTFAEEVRAHLAGDRVLLELEGPSLLVICDAAFALVPWSALTALIFFVLAARQLYRALAS